MGNPHRFIDSARNMKLQYVVIHFIAIFAMIVVPVFLTVVTTRPYEMYHRVVNRLDGAGIHMHQGINLAPDYLDAADKPGILVFDDYIVFVDTNLALSIPADLFGTDAMPYTFNELFTVIAVYNLYITSLLIPMLLLSMVIMFVLHLFFYAVTAYFLGAFRIRSTYFGFGERLKISIMGSLPVAAICAAVGFFIPIVHVILFQMVNLLVLFHLSKRYDTKEKEMLGVL